MRRFVFTMLFVASVFGQTTPPAAFEVASVKLGQQSAGRDFRLLPGGRLHITNLTVNVILRQAYGLEHYQISGGPAWLDTDPFDIEAKASGEPSKEQMLSMLQTLLADRFQLKVRREAREQNVYVLVVGKGGHKLEPASGDRVGVSLYRIDPLNEPGVHYALAAKRADLALIAKYLGQQLRRPVLDRTQIEGEYSFKVTYAIDDNPESGTLLLTAVQEQLGLKLESTIGPVETLVVERAEKPSAN